MSAPTASAPDSGAASPTSPSPTSDSSDDALSSTVPYLSAFLLPYPLRIHCSPRTGRYVTATAAIASSSVVLQSRAFVKGLHSSFLRRVCDACWRYHHGRGWPLKCNKCRQVWWCSKPCMHSAHTSPPTPSSPDAPPPGREWLADDDHFAVLDAGLHALECGTLRKLNGLKVDKDTAGMLRAIVRIYFKLQHMPPSADTSPSPALAPSAVASSPSQLPTPTSYDFDLLIGHTALSLPSLVSPTSPSPSPSSLASVTRTSHELFWVDVRGHFVRLLGHAALPALYSILAKLESNAFGLYAAPPDLPSPTPSTSTADPSSPPPAPSTPPQESEAAAVASEDAGRVVLTSTVDRENLGLRSIGRSLYPSASYLNHSCEPNCEVFETGSILQVCAKADIAEGDEVTISYIDTNQRLRERRRQLLETYFFTCQCTRCAREEAREEGKEEESDDAPPTVAPSYASEARRKKSRKRGARLKKKKIEAKFHSPPQPQPQAGSPPSVADLRLERLQLS